MVKIHRQEIGAGERSSAPARGPRPARAPARRPTRTAQTSVVLTQLEPLDRWEKPAPKTVKRRSPRRVGVRERDKAEGSLETVGEKIEDVKPREFLSRATDMIERKMGRTLRGVCESVAHYLFGEDVSVGVKRASCVYGLRRGSQMGRFYRLEGYRGTFKVIEDKDLGRGLSFLNLVREDVPKGYGRRIEKLGYVPSVSSKPKQGSFERIGKFVLETAKEGKGWAYLMPGCLKKPKDK